jgi:hypothetical protein
MKQRIRGEVRGTKDSSKSMDYRGGYGGLRRRFRPIDDVSERGKEREGRGGLGEGVGGSFGGRFGLGIARGEIVHSSYGRRRDLGEKKLMGGAHQSEREEERGCWG